MGQHEISGDSERGSLAFKQAILNDLDALDFMLAHGMVEDAMPRIGAEQEMFLVDAALRPAPVAGEVLARLNDPRFTTEIGKFNLEANLSPIGYSGDCLRVMERELNALLEKAGTAARACGAEILLAGTLPTAHQYHLSLENLTPKPRYFELNRMMTKLRGPTYSIFIKGADELHVTHDNVMMEACCESFQVHFQVSPGNFALAYNLAQLACAPVLAAAVNSPLLLGQRLWQETRIALFQHSVDERSKTLLVRGAPPRVSFGECWLERSAIEIFREEVARFRVIMMMDVREDARQIVASGGIPELQALRLHNGTVWRWNRPCYGVIDGKAHLRIEARCLPAGPSVLDEVANAAFLFGLLTGMAGEYSDIRNIFAFEDAKQNFYVAARQGLHATFAWPGNRRIPATALILKELLPLARLGLRAAQICTEDIDRYLGTIEERVRRGRTGSQWAFDSLAGMREQGSREAKHRCLTAAMLQNQKSGEPVHLWKLVEMPQAGEASVVHSTVEDSMSTDLFTVRADDLVRLAANLMHWRNIGHIPVEDDEGRLIGMVTQGALIQLLAERSSHADFDLLLVREVMRRDPPKVGPEYPVLRALEDMRDRKADCLAVVVGERLVGILTLHDVINTLAKFFQEPAPATKAAGVS